MLRYISTFLAFALIAAVIVWPKQTYPVAKFDYSFEGLEKPGYDDGWYDDAVYGGEFDFSDSYAD